MNSGPVLLLFLSVLLPVALAAGWVLGRRRLHQVELDLATTRAELKAASEVAREREELLAGVKAARINARVANGGDALARPGDIFGEADWSSGESGAVSIVLDRIVGQ